MKPASACPTCATLSERTYCPECGERLNRDMERSLIHFIGESAASVFQIADSKIGRSFWTLARRPGELTLAYMEGRRIPFLHPFRLFIVANIVFFLVVSITGSSPVTTKLQTHIESENFFHKDLAKRLVEREVERSGQSFEAYETIFNRRIDTFSKTLVFVMIPMMALIIGLFFVFKREYAVKHLAFSCHAYAFLLFYNFLLITTPAAIFVGLVGLGSVLDSFQREFLYSSISLLAQSAFFYFGLRSAYGMKIWTSLVLAFVLGLLVYIILLVYRAILFFTTFYSMML